MTEPVIKLSKQREDEIRAELEAELTERDAQIADKNAEIQRLQELVKQLSAGNTVA